MWRKACGQVPIGNHYIRRNDPFLFKICCGCHANFCEDFFPFRYSEKADAGILFVNFYRTVTYLSKSSIFLS